MPLLDASSYRAPTYLFTGHLETIYPYLFRRVQANYERERVELPDGDFVDLDWAMEGHDRLMILCHGLEGGADSQYMQGMTIVANEHKWDVLAINFRSCSGEINRRLKMYHHGDISDLSQIIDRVVEKLDYQKIGLCGFSLGGNVILKYLGVSREQVPDQISGGVAISVPCDLASSSEALDQWQNYLYTRRFRRSLFKKFVEKEQRFPGTLDLSKYHRIKKWSDFDNTYTTKLTPFNSAEEYYAQGSAKNFIEDIVKPTLILNAENDPFLKDLSYPRDKCKNHPYVYLEIPKQGGHVGFWHTHRQPAFSELRTMQFMEALT